MPESHFALNHAADIFAERGAKAHEVGMHIASGIMYHSALVKKIQKRLVRILISHVDKITYDKKSTPFPISSASTLEDHIQNTRHNLVIAGSSLRCLDCSGSCSKGSTNVKNWLKAPCDPLPFDDSEAWVQVPAWHVLNIGSCVPHHSHNLMSYKGIAFCNECGAYSAKKCRLLNSECKKHCSLSSARAVRKLKNGELPISTMRWPRPPVRGKMQVPAERCSMAGAPFDSSSDVCADNPVASSLALVSRHSTFDNPDLDMDLDEEF